MVGTEMELEVELEVSLPILMVVVFKFLQLCFGWWCSSVVDYAMILGGGGVLLPRLKSFVPSGIARRVGLDFRVVALAATTLLL